MTLRDSNFSSNESELFSELLDYWRMNSDRWQKHIMKSPLPPKEFIEEFQQFTETFCTKWKDYPYISSQVVPEQYPSQYSDLKDKGSFNIGGMDCPYGFWVLESIGVSYSIFIDILHDISKGKNVDTGILRETWLESIHCRGKVKLSKIEIQILERLNEVINRFDVSYTALSQATKLSVNLIYKKWQEMVIKRVTNTQLLLNWPKLGMVQGLVITSMSTKVNSSDSPFLEQLFLFPEINKQILLIILPYSAIANRWEKIRGYTLRPILKETQSLSLGSYLESEPNFTQELTQNFMQYDLDPLNRNWRPRKHHHQEIPPIVKLLHYYYFAGISGRKSTIKRSFGYQSKSVIHEMDKRIRNQRLGFPYLNVRPVIGIKTMLICYLEKNKDTQEALVHELSRLVPVAFAWHTEDSVLVRALIPKKWEKVLLEHIEEQFPNVLTSKIRMCDRALRKKSLRTRINLLELWNSKSWCWKVPDDITLV